MDTGTFTGKRGELNEGQTQTPNGTLRAGIKRYPGSRGRRNYEKINKMWRWSNKLPNNGTRWTHLGHVPMTEALTPCQADVMSFFLADLIKAADRCTGKKDITAFMKEWSEIYLEGKRVAV